MNLRNFCTALFGAILLSGWFGTGQAATITAAALTPSAVQTAINSAANGDTVKIPAGSATWTTGVTVTGKSITLAGAGTGQTIIHRSTTDNSVRAILVYPLAATNTFKMSGIEFDTVNPASNGIVAIGVPNGTTPVTAQFRISNCKFNHTPTGGGSASGTRGVYISGTYGLIDHCTFVSTAANGGQMITLDPNNTRDGIMTWHTPQAWGDANNVFVEDCTFNAYGPNDGAIDAYEGVRYVFRHNTVHNTNVGNHGYDSSYRGARSMEIYNNTFTNDGVVSVGFPAVIHRAGGLLFHDNTMSGGVIGIGYYIWGANPLNNRPRPMAPNAAWGSVSAGVDQISTSNPGAPNFRSAGADPVDGNTVTGGLSAGYPLLDQPGRGSFPSYTNGNPGNWPNTTTGYASSAYQVLDPVYTWNNIVAGVSLNDIGANGEPLGVNFMQLNRDYYVDTAKSGYTPYTYPHPLSLGAPSNLRVVQP
jgi:hypothetical protein